MKKLITILGICVMISACGKKEEKKVTLTRETWNEYQACISNGVKAELKKSESGRSFMGLDGITRLCYTRAVQTDELRRYQQKQGGY